MYLLCGLQSLNEDSDSKPAYLLPQIFFSKLRDKSGLECDAVVHLRNGQYGLIEVKLGGKCEGRIMTLSDIQVFQEPAGGRWFTEIKE